MNKPGNKKFIAGKEGKGAIQGTREKHVQTFARNRRLRTGFQKRGRKGRSP